MQESVNVTSLAIRLEHVSGQIDNHIKSCEAASLQAADASKLAAAAMVRMAERLESIEKAPMRVLGYLCGAIVIPAGLILGQNYFLHQSTAQKADLAAQNAETAVQVQKVDSHKLDALIAAQTNTAKP